MARHHNINNYCDSLYSELAGMKETLGSFLAQIDLMEGKDQTVLNSHVKHIDELIRTIDWKMEIFSKECPISWKTLGKESEDTTSVPASETFKSRDFPSGGFAGG